MEVSRGDIRVPRGGFGGCVLNAVISDSSARDRSILNSIHTITDINISATVADAGANSGAGSAKGSGIGSGIGRGATSCVHTSENGNQMVAIGCGSVLTILQSKTTDDNKPNYDDASPQTHYDLAGDLEFDGAFPIVSVSWAAAGAGDALLLVAQANGAVHFVSSTAQLLFSHSILSSKCGDNVAVVLFDDVVETTYFIRSQSQTSSPCLIAYVCY
jgi:hypothetical protein